MKNIFALVFLSSALAPSHAATVFYDSFNYAPAGTSLSTAGAPSWSLLTGTTDPTIGSGSLSYPGLDTAPGDNSVLLNGTSGTITGVSSRQLGQVFNITNTAALYYSMTFRVNTISNADWAGGANLTNGSFMAGFNQKTTGAFVNGDAAAPLLIRGGDPANVSGTNNDFRGFQLGTGVTQTSPGSRVFDGTRVYNPGDTLFLVLSYTFGSSTNDDIARLYVNPTPGSLESANTAVVTATGVADVNNSQIQAFFLRNNSVEPSATQVDDLRVGTAWADVTPVPEPSTIALLGMGAFGLMLARRFRR